MGVFLAFAAAMEIDVEDSSCTGRAACFHDLHCLFGVLAVEILAIQRAKHDGHCASGPLAADRRIIVNGLILLAVVVLAVDRHDERAAKASHGKNDLGKLRVETLDTARRQMVVRHMRTVAAEGGGEILGGRLVRTKLVHVALVARNIGGKHGALDDHAVHMLPWPNLARMHGGMRSGSHCLAQAVLLRKCTESGNLACLGSLECLFVLMQTALLGLLAGLPLGQISSFLGKRAAAELGGINAVSAAVLDAISAVRFGVFGLKCTCARLGFLLELLLLGHLAHFLISLGLELALRLCPTHVVVKVGLGLVCRHAVAHHLHIKRRHLLLALGSAILLAALLAALLATLSFSAARLVVVVVAPQLLEHVHDLLENVLHIANILVSVALQLLLLLVELLSKLVLAKRRTAAAALAAAKEILDLADQTLDAVDDSTSLADRAADVKCNLVGRRIKRGADQMLVCGIFGLLAHDLFDEIVVHTAGLELCTGLFPQRLGGVELRQCLLDLGQRRLAGQGNGKDC
eukprot:comp18268_c0_seq1/m.32350 comp18268_c0_seq1/g.32350  ORF comp18268_c0_seq1/g.32350 comp18268_c0_seq1/m.32350 type:complete len:518 (-) comp18268_c0_seq1:41-1594(-)